MARGGFDRRARVASLIRQTVAELLTFEVKDPRIAGVTVTDAEVTGDLREAKIFYSLNGGEAERAAAQAGLERAAGFIRRELGQRIALRTTPTVAFHFDASLDYGARIDEKLRELGLGGGGDDEEDDEDEDEDLDEDDEDYDDPGEGDFADDSEDDAS